MLIDLLIFVIAAFVLLKSVNITITSLANLAKSVNISEFVIATIFMGAATSFPELFIGINSAIKNIPQLSLGNVIGASLLDLTLVIGAPVLIAKGILSKSKYIVQDTKYMVFTIFLPLLLLLDKTISRIDGIILIAAFGLCIRYLLKQKRFKKATKKIIPQKLKKNILMFILGVFLLLISSHFAVKHAELIALELKIPTTLIGLILVSFGTTLPELTFGIKAALSKHSGMAVGNLVGSVVFNLLFIVGFTSILRPITPEIKPLILGSIFLIIASLFFYHSVKNGRTITVREGIILSAIYIIFLILEFTL